MMWRNRVLQRRFRKMNCVKRVGKLTDEAKFAGIMLAYMGIKFDWDKDDIPSIRSINASNVMCVVRKDGGK